MKAIVVSTHYRDADREVERAILHVYFTDGTEWTGVPAEPYQPLADFLVRKTGKPLTRTRFADGPPAN